MNVLLLFDFDGVLADSLDVFHESLAGACAARGFPRLADRNAFLEIFDENMTAGLLRTGIPEDAIPEILDELGARLTAAMDRYPPFAGIPETISSLAAAAPVYVITSNLTRVVERYLERYGIRGVRDVLGSDRERSKQVKIRTLAARWPALQPVYIGDTLGDMREAHAAGVRAVAAGWGWHAEARLSQGRPDRVLHNPPDLMSLISEKPASGAGVGDKIPEVAQRRLWGTV